MDNFALSIASDLLLSGPQSYFHEALLEPGYGSGLAPGSGYGNSRRETAFSVGVKGVGEDDIPIVEQKIQETLEKVAKSGFRRNRVDSTLHQIELDAAAVKPNFGLMLYRMSAWGTAATFETAENTRSRGNFQESGFRSSVLAN